MLSHRGGLQRDVHDLMAGGRAQIALDAQAAMLSRRFSFPAR